MGCGASKGKPAKETATVKEADPKPAPDSPVAIVPSPADTKNSSSGSNNAENSKKPAEKREETPTVAVEEEKQVPNKAPRVPPSPHGAPPPSRDPLPSSSAALLECTRLLNDTSLDAGATDTASVLLSLREEFEKNAAAQVAVAGNALGKTGGKERKRAWRRFARTGAVIERDGASAGAGVADADDEDAPLRGLGSDGDGRAAGDVETDAEALAEIGRWFRENVAANHAAPVRPAPERPDAKLVDAALKGGIYIDPEHDEGDDPTLPGSMPVFRPFISSTFTDTALERDLMIDHLYPFLAERARRSGVSFVQPSEMRWGIGPALERAHLTWPTCYTELSRCKASDGLNYVLILGDKYGSRFPRTYIDVPVFEALRRVIPKVFEEGENGGDASHLGSADDALALVDEWYVLDTNHARYGLRHLETDELNSRYWGGEAARLHGILALAAEHLFPEGDPRRALFTISITHEEAFHGIDLVPRADRAACVALVVRNLDGIERADPAKDSAVRFWADVDASRTGPAMPARRAMWANKRHLFGPDPGDNDYDYPATAYSIDYAEGKGIDPRRADHRSYLCAFLSDMARVMVASLDGLATRMGGLNQYMRSDHTLHEALVHNAFARRKNAAFVHTRATRECVARVVEFASGEGESHLFAIVGTSGTGKTSLLANAVGAVREKLAPRGVRTIARFLGTTSRSSDVVPLLATLCEHIVRLYGDTLGRDEGGASAAAVSAALGAEPSDDWRCDLTDVAELTLLFRTLLEAVPGSNPLVIFLDSLDQLSALHHARRLDFLPSKLSNPHVRVVVSTLPEPRFESWPALLRIFAPRGPPHVLVRPWETEDAETVLDAVLERRGCSLTDAQRGHVIESFRECPTSLYLALAMHIADAWRSTDPVMDRGACITGGGGDGRADDSSNAMIRLSAAEVKQEMARLENRSNGGGDHHQQQQQQHQRAHLTHAHLAATTVQGLVLQLLTRLSLVHGPELSDAVLGLLTAAEGLSEAELMDVLSLDDTVLGEVFKWWTPPRRRLPPIVLARVVADLRAFLVDREDHGERELVWYHRQLAEGAQVFSLGARPGGTADAFAGATATCTPAARRRHAQLVPYLDGRWAGVPKPIGGGGGGGTEKEKEKEGEKGSATQPSADRLVPAMPWLDAAADPARPTPATRKLWLLPTSAVAARRWGDARDALCSVGALECAALGGMARELSAALAGAEAAARAWLADRDGGEPGASEEDAKAAQSLIDHASDFARYLRRNPRVLDDWRSVLQAMLNAPRDSLVAARAREHVCSIDGDAEGGNVAGDGDGNGDGNGVVKIGSRTAPSDTTIASGRSLALLVNRPPRSEPVLARITVPASGRVVKVDTWFASDAPDASPMVAHGGPAVLVAVAVSGAGNGDDDGPRLLLCDADGARVLCDCALPIADPVSIAFSTEGARVACVGSDGTLAVATLAPDAASVLDLATVRFDLESSARDWAGGETLPNGGDGSGPATSFSAGSQVYWASDGAAVVVPVVTPGEYQWKLPVGVVVAMVNTSESKTAKGENAEGGVKESVKESADGDTGGLDDSIVVGDDDDSGGHGVERRVAAAAARGDATEADAASRAVAEAVSAVGVQLETLATSDPRVSAALGSLCHAKTLACGGGDTSLSPCGTFMLCHGLGKLVIKSLVAPGQAPFPLDLSEYESCGGGGGVCAVSIGPGLEAHVAMRGVVHVVRLGATEDACAKGLRRTEKYESMGRPFNAWTSVGPTVVLPDVGFVLSANEGGSIWVLNDTVLAQGPDSAAASSLSEDQLLRAIEVETQVTGHAGSQASAMRVSRTGDRMVTHAPGELLLWDLRQIQAEISEEAMLRSMGIVTHRGHTKDIQDIVWSEDGSHFVAVSSDNTAGAYYGLTGDAFGTCRLGGIGLQALWDPTLHREKGSRTDGDGDGDVDDAPAAFFLLSNCDTRRWITNAGSDSGGADPDMQLRPPQRLPGDKYPSQIVAVKKRDSPVTSLLGFDARSASWHAVHYAVGKGVTGVVPFRAFASPATEGGKELTPNYLWTASQRDGSSFFALWCGSDGRSGRFVRVSADKLLDIVGPDATKESHDVDFQSCALWDVETPCRPVSVSFSIPELDVVAVVPHAAATVVCGDCPGTSGDGSIGEEAASDPERDHAHRLVLHSISTGRYLCTIDLPGASLVPRREEGSLMYGGPFPGAWHMHRMYTDERVALSSLSCDARVIPSEDGERFRIVIAAVGSSGGVRTYEITDWDGTARSESESDIVRANPLPSHYEVTSAATCVRFTTEPAEQGPDTQVVAAVGHMSGAVSLVRMMIDKHESCAAWV